jgi:hypothetical protein
VGLTPDEAWGLTCARRGADTGRGAELTLREAYDRCRPSAVDEFDRAP